MGEKKKTSGQKKQVKQKKSSTGQKSTGKKSGKTKKEKKPYLGDELKKIGAGLAILLFVVATAAMVFDFYFNEKSAGPGVFNRDQVKVAGKTQEKGALKDKNSHSALKKPLSGLKEKQGRPAKKQGQPDIREKADPPVFEIFETPSSRDHVKRESIEKQTRPEKHPEIPRVAIIIDDIGFDRKIADALNRLDKNITFSILPGSPFGRSVAASLHEKGSEIMLHLPMEPEQYPEVDPGPGAIMSYMNPDEVLTQLRKNLDILPHIRGVNNHMGSKITADSAKMHQIFTVLKIRNLFFIDSVTSRKSRCRSSAALLQIPFGQRDVFLDNIQEPEYIRKQIQELMEAARRHGTAIGIGHPYPATYLALEQIISELRSQVQIVPASSLVAVPG